MAGSPATRGDEAIPTSVRVDRRRFLGGSLALGAAIAMFGACSSGDDDPATTATTESLIKDPTEELEELVNLTTSPFLDAYFTDVSKAALVGAAYTQNVADGDVEALVVPDDFRARVMTGPADQAAIDAMRGDIRAEFEGSDMVSVSGWRLSRSEVYLALIASGA